MDGSMFLPEFDHEFSETRRALERVPEEKFDWKPHEKSWSLHDLAAHVSEIPNWMEPTLEVDTLDIDGYEREVPETKEAILAKFDEGVAAARASLSAASGEQLASMWSMTSGGNVLMEMPKVAVVRSFIMNHNVHHRAQLGVYLRMLGVDVPGHYGPSADEGDMGAEQ